MEKGYEVGSGRLVGVLLRVFFKPYGVSGPELRGGGEQVGSILLQANNRCKSLASHGLRGDSYSSSMGKRDDIPVMISHHDSMGTSGGRSPSRCIQSWSTAICMLRTFAFALFRQTLVASEEVGRVRRNC